MVYSHTSSPVSIHERASGMKRIFCAFFKALLPSRRMAWSWKMLLKFMNWMPVMSYTSFLEMTW